MKYQIVIDSKQATIANAETGHTELVAQGLINLAAIRETADAVKEEVRATLADAKANGVSVDVSKIRAAMAAAKIRPQRISELLAEFGLQRGKTASKTSKGAQVKAENLLAKLLPIVKANVKGLSQTERAAVIHRLTLALKAEFSK